MRWTVVLSYDGTDFSGWQIQPSARTVQGELQRALKARFRCEIPTMGQGRTDAGVHAVAQTAHIDLPDSENEIQVKTLIRGLQTFLPDDIKIIDARPVPETFHARFDAESREYRYLVTNGCSPLLNRVAWSISRTLSQEMLQDMATALIGEHDFVNFCIPPEHEGATTRCNVIHCSWKRMRVSGNGDYFPYVGVQQENESVKMNNKCPWVWVFTIKADRFLRHMVRRLVGTMVRLAELHRYDVKETVNQTDPDSFKIKRIKQWQTMLKGKEVGIKSFTAPPQGLTLLRVNYPSSIRNPLFGIPD